jgi:signal transduction histidine kinase
LKSLLSKSLLRLAVLLSITATASYTKAGDALPRSVLLLDQENQSRVWNFDLANALRSVLTADPGLPITVYADNLDLARVAGPAYEKALRAFLIEKYRNIQIGVIVVNGVRALDLVLSLRRELWPNVPVVFAAVDDDAAARMKSVPNVTGHIMRLTLRDMVSTARLVVPNLKQIVLVGDPLDKNTFFRGFLAEIPELKNSNLELIDLTGLPMTELKQRTATLPAQSVIAYTTLTVDGAGIDYLPREAVAAIASVANRPIVTGTVNFVGYGALGGLVVSSPPIGEHAGRLALRILKGEKASDIPVTVGDFKKPIYDWREIKRWNVSEDSLPRERELRFQQPGIWEQYHRQMLAIAGALLAQAAAITALLFERRRRNRAEIDSRASLLQAAHMNRVAAAAALTTSIAHELNQPLGAILSNTETAELLMTAEVIDTSLIKEILSSIREDDQRAAEIIKRLGGLLKGNRGSGLKELDLNHSVQTALKILAPEAAKRQVLLQTDLEQRPLFVHFDEIHFQQIILNLVINGMDAMQAVARHEQIIMLRTRLCGSEATVSVSDTGIGIPSGKLESIFEPFVTTKPEGTGLGLSIAQTIIRTYGGRIWADNVQDRGAVFHFTMPIAVPAD